MPDTYPDATILVVDDEPNVAESYALRLGMQYDHVETAIGGEAAMDVLETAGADVVLLDRRMPEMHGDDVARKIQQDLDYDPRVIMATAVEADFDIVEMPFNDYLQKPIGKEDMITAVQQQLEARVHGQKLSEYFSCRSTLEVLEAEKSTSELGDSEEYQRLQEKAQSIEEDLAQTVDEFDEVAKFFDTIDRA
jgi:DNA-binding response OmpR family regulator